MLSPSWMRYIFPSFDIPKIALRSIPVINTPPGRAVAFEVFLTRVYPLVSRTQAPPILLEPVPTSRRERASASELTASILLCALKASA
jgi:hypothetical protein